MHKRGLCRHAVSVTFVSCVKTNKDIFEIFSQSGSQAILVFPYQTGWRYSDGTPLPLTGASNAGGGGKKRDSGRLSGFAAYRSIVLSTVGVANCEKQSRERRAHRGVHRPLFAQDDDEVFVTLYAGDKGQPPPRTQIPWL